MKMAAWQPVRCHKCSHFSFISLQIAFTGSKCSHPTSTSHSEQRHEPRVTKRKTEEKCHEVKPLLISIAQCPIVSHACLLFSIHMEHLKSRYLTTYLQKPPDSWGIASVCGAAETTCCAAGQPAWVIIRLLRGCCVYHYVCTVRWCSLANANSKNINQRKEEEEEDSGLPGEKRNFSK